MSYLLRMFGSFEIEATDGESEPLPLVRKTRAILAYLAATGTTHSRRALYELFCQRAADPAGTLRWHLSRIRSQLGRAVLQASRREVAFNTEFADTDFTVLQGMLAEPETRSDSELAEAVVLYRGEFLADLSLPDAPDFELWKLGERTRCQQLYETGAGELIERYIQRGRYADAIALAQALLQTNSLLEPVHIQLIWLYARTGQRDAALQQAEQCQAILWQELAIEPSFALQELLQAIRENGPLPSPVAAKRSRMRGVMAETPSFFVGRAAELERLLAAWKSTSEKGGATVLVSAVAGGGKTRLVEEFGRTIPQKVQQLRGNCYESTRSIPYQPWLSILEGRLALLDADARSQLKPHWQQHLAFLQPTLGPAPGNPPDKQYLFRAVSQLLLALRTGPLVLVIEDLQWADEASLQLLQFLAERASQASCRTLLVGTFRSEEAEINPALITLTQDLKRTGALTRLILPPLGARDVEALIGALWPKLPAGYRAPHIRDMLLEAAGGNPLFTMEILQELSLADELPRDLPIPPSLSELIRRRLSRLPGSMRQVIEALAVLNRPAHFDLARRVSARTEDETLAAIETGLRWRFLQLDERTSYDFSHDLLRQGVEKELSPIRRQRLHHRAATMLAQAAAEPATLAYHWRMAGNREQEAATAAQAGDRAARLYAHDEARRFYRRVLEIAQEPPLQLQAMLGLGRDWHFTGRWDEAEEIFREVLDLARAEKLANQQAAGLYHLGLLKADRGDGKAAMRRYQQAERLFQELQDRRGLCLVAGSIGSLYSRQARHDEARGYYERQLELAQEIDDLPQAAKALGAIGGVSYQRGRYDQALAYCRQALAIEEELGNRSEVAAHTGNLGLIHRRRGDNREAISRFHQRMEIAHELENQRGMVSALNSSGTVYRLQGEVEPALLCFAASVALSVRLGHPQGLSLAVASLGGTLLLQGRIEEGLRALDLGIMLARRMNLRFVLCAYLNQKVDTFTRQERWQEARALNDEVLQMAAAIGRKDIHCIAETAVIHLDFLLGEISRAQADHQFRQLAAERTGDSEQAALIYERWRLDPTDADLRQEAAARYRALYERTPNHDYRERYGEITGEPLPEPPPLPPPPSFVSPVPQPFSALLDRVNEFVVAADAPA